MRIKPLIVGVSVAALCVLGFLELAEDLVGSESILAFDRMLTSAIQSLRAPTLTALMRAVTTAGGSGLVTVAAIALVVRLTAARQQRDALFVAGVVAACGLTSWTLKGLYGRVRPPQALALIELPTDYSFPSGHTLGSLALGGCIIYLAHRSTLPALGKVLAMFVAIAYPALVGVSRVYLGVHWPSDVLASWLAGAAVLSVGIGIRTAVGHAAHDAAEKSGA